MAEIRSGAGWTVEVDDGVMIWEFRPGMNLAAFKEEAYPVYEDLLQDREFDGMITHVKLGAPFNDEVFSLWEQGAKRAHEAGIGRWALVVRGIKSLSLQNRIDVDGLETMTTEDLDEAIEWVNE